MEKIDTMRLTVEPFHVDFTGRLLLGVLGNHMLNAAGDHSARRGWGISTLNENHHTWVLSRLSIEMTDMPRSGETFELQTWVESVMRLFTNRNFAIRRADGTPCGYARSVWAMINTETRRPDNLLTLFDGDILRYVVSPEENICPIAGHSNVRLTEPQLARTVETHYSDVDINGHINSIKYIEHILDLFPRERLERGIRRFEIAYKTESYWGDALDLYTQALACGATLVEVRRADQVVCQAKVIFNV